MERVFNGVIDRTRAMLDIKTVKTLFGRKRRSRRRNGKEPRWEIVVERPEYSLTIFKIHFGRLTLKIYTKGEHVLRIFGAFGTIAAGGLGCLWGGWVADRVGRARLVNAAMAASGVCSLAVGFAFGGSPWAVASIALVWGFFVVADSAQFSALVTEVAPPHAVGTALTLQTSAGFLLMYQFS